MKHLQALTASLVAAMLIWAPAQAGSIAPRDGWTAGNPSGAIEKKVRVVSTIDFFLRN